MTETSSPSARGTRAATLVLGYGNPGRQDDGLGPAAAEAIERLALPGVRTSANYQLVIEDASDAAECERVFFIDASRSGIEPFSSAPLLPKHEVAAFVSHVVRPEFILDLCRRLYGRTPHATLIAIRGYEFSFGEGLTAGARENLRHALAHLRETLLSSAWGSSA